MLDFQKIAPEIGGLASETARQSQVRAEQAVVAHAAAGRCSDEWSALAPRIAAAQTRWLTARPMDPAFAPIAEWSELPPAPDLYTAIACDGSQIPLDRHEIAPFYLLNIGQVALHYGSGRKPLMTSSAGLFYREEDLLIQGEADSDDDPARPSMSYITERELASRRFALEMESLAELIEKFAADPAAPRPVAFVDGTLILWTAEAQSAPERNKTLAQFLAVLERARAARVPVVGYLSRPASREVIGALRVSLCGMEPRVVCRSCYLAGSADPLPCEPIDRLTDSDIYARILAPGQRSPLFLSDSRVLQSYKPEEQKIAFCYLRVDGEIARLEMPRWVADDEDLLNRCHAVAYDQSCKGRGYPVCLSEAHEQAVVRAPERAALLRLLERALSQADIPSLRTAKSLAKRTRVL